MLDTTPLAHRRSKALGSQPNDAVYAYMTPGLQTNSKEWLLFMFYLKMPWLRRGLVILYQSLDGSLASFN